MQTQVILSMWSWLSPRLRLPKGILHWLRHWILHLHKQDTVIGSSLPTFVATLWTIWLLSNAQVFRQQCPTAPSVIRIHHESMHQHLCYAQQQRDPTRNPFDPTIPPRFQGAQLGHQPSHMFSLTIYIAGTKFRGQQLNGVAWLGTMRDHIYQHQHGSLCYSSSNIQTEATTCLKALSWTWATCHTQVLICTSSQGLVQALQAPKPILAYAGPWKIFVLPAKLCCLAFF